MGTLLMHYKRPEIQEAILEQVKDKEIAVRYNAGFGKRPDTLQYKNDILELVKKGATSFHVSEELWSNPLALEPTLRRQELDQLRKGWDLILDIDCEILDYSAIAADLLIKALRHSGISSITCKFSGNHGFHIAVPFEAFPEKVNNVPTKDLFPEAPRKIAEYLQEKIRKYLSKSILKKDSIDTIMKKMDKKFNEIVKEGEFDPFTILDVDTILISSRHLYRMLYCFNEKSGLVSVPVDPDKVLEFKKETAKPENVRMEHDFLTRQGVQSEEAKQLFIQAFDFSMKRERELEDIKESITPKREFEDFQEAVPQELFPPCMMNGLKGMGDGKKRFLFTAINFLTSVGWTHEEAEQLLTEWNKRNKEPLRENIMIGQIRYHKQHKKKVLPPNCNNTMYFVRGAGICQPDNLCDKIKNPVNYSRRKSFYLNKEKKEVFVKAKKKKEEMPREKNTKIAESGITAKNNA